MSAADVPRPLAQSPNLIANIIQRVSELPDRTSPDEWPEVMAVTGDELRAILDDELGELVAAHQSFLDDDETWAAKWRRKYEAAEAEIRSLLAARDALAQEVEEGRKQLERVREERDLAWAAFDKVNGSPGLIGTMVAQRNALQDELGEAQRQIAALRDALERHGGHFLGCRRTMGAEACTCGFDAAKKVSGESRP